MIATLCMVGAAACVAAFVDSVLNAQAFNFDQGHAKRGWWALGGAVVLLIAAFVLRGVA